MISIGVVVATVVLAVAASMLIQWASGRSAAFSIVLAILIVLALAVAAVFALRIAAGRLD